MARVIHCVDTPDGPRFREWSTILDRYVTDPMTRDEALDYLTNEDISRVRWAANTRLIRAEESGTSNYDMQRTKREWDTERCDSCESFHHEWLPSGRAADSDVNGNPTTEEGCRECGLTRAEPSHGPVCVED